ncbi:MAG: glycosyltransferase [Immundisolibacter sp.]|uniref:glycosyltransferase n=1 Tax=Immundisolibacter sp. TaxID=1934948 RepID=UPI003D141E0E
MTASAGEPPAADARRGLLMVAFHYPPDNSSTGVLRSLKFTRHLLDLGWRSHVLTVDPAIYAHRDAALEAQIPPAVSVTRLPCRDAKQRWSIAGRYPAIVEVPDRFGSWRGPAIRAGRSLIAKDAVQAIYSTYPVPSAHMIALALKRRSGLPWLADFRDPWAGGGGRGWRYRVDAWLERRVVQAADRVLANTDAARDDFVARYPDVPAERFVTLPNGYDETDFAELPMPDRERFHIVYPGSINRSNRDPTPLLQAIGALLRAGRLPRAQTRITLLGCGAAGAQPWLRELLTAEGLTDLTQVVLERVPYRDSLHQLARAGLLVVLNEAAGDTREDLAYARLMVPAKVYEYLRLGRPFLVLCGAGAVPQLLARTGGGAACAAADQARIQAHIEQAFVGWQAGDRGAAPSDIVSQFERRQLSSRLAQALDQVCGRAP